MAAARRQKRSAVWAHNRPAGRCPGRRGRPQSEAATTSTAWRRRRYNRHAGPDTGRTEGHMNSQQPGAADPQDFPRRIRGPWRRAGLPGLASRSKPRARGEPPEFPCIAVGEPVHRSRARVSFPDRRPGCRVHRAAGAAAVRPARSERGFRPGRHSPQRQHGRCRIWVRPGHRARTAGAGSPVTPGSYTP
jgi:hypothetical protein